MQYDNGTVLHGDSLRILRDMRGAGFDAIVTDPPYSSGGQFRGDRAQPTALKYNDNQGAAEYIKHSFSGDNLDQRAWTSWSAEWLSLARDACKTGAAIAIFCDWRQLAALMDAVQWGGWVLRGLLAWDKINSRPQPGRPRQQCEFVVWGSNGPLDVKRDAAYLPGMFSCLPPPTARRSHQTEKPLALMRDLVRICERRGMILDPFAGSGSTLEAGILEGYKAIGIEKDDYYHGVASRRAADALEQLKQIKFDMPDETPPPDQVTFDDFGEVSG